MKEMVLAHQKSNITVMHELDAVGEVENLGGTPNPDEAGATPAPATISNESEGGVPGLH